MPLLRITELDGGGMLGLWEITESSDAMLEEIVLSEKEKEIYGTLHSSNRRKQWLAYRMLLMHILGTGITPDVYYDKYGKPHLAYYDYQISVSHSQLYAAVIVHPLFRVGVDIELIRDNIIRIASRFLSEKELVDIHHENKTDMLHVYWGAKEAVYKAFGRKELDFIENIHLFPSPSGKINPFPASIIKKGLRIDFRVYYEIIGEYMLVFSLEEKKGEDFFSQFSNDKH